MPTMTPCPKDDPLMIAWMQFQSTGDYENAKQWAAKPEHLQGSLWAVFEAGFRAATERAAGLHEQVDSASDAERLDRLPGAGAMGAVVEYRDKIRQTIAAR
jgi:hypothetical protein